MVKRLPPTRNHTRKKKFLEESFLSRAFLESAFDLKEEDRKTFRNARETREELALPINATFVKSSECRDSHIYKFQKICLATFLLKGHSLSEAAVVSRKFFRFFLQYSNNQYLTWFEHVIIVVIIYSCDFHIQNIAWNINSNYHPCRPLLKKFQENSILGIINVLLKLILSLRWVK